MRGVDDYQVHARLHQALGAGKAEIADRGRRRHAQAPLLVLAGIGIRHRLLDVLHGDQADAAVLRINDQKLLDPVLMQQALRLLLAHPFPHRDQTLLGHQLRHRLPGIGGKAHVTVGENTDQLAASGPSRRLDHRDSGDVVDLHESERIGQRRIRLDGDRIDHHAGLELFHPADLLRLLFGLKIAVDHPDAARLGHGDRHLSLGDGVHRGRDDRDVEGDRPGDSRPDIDLGRHHVREPRLQQHVVESERLAQAPV